MPVTQDHIAAHLGISTKTVMRALSGQDKVAPSTYKRVVEAAQELGYTEHSNSLARLLMARRYDKAVLTGTVGVAIGGLDTRIFNDPFIAPVIAGISDECVRQGRHITLCLSGIASKPRLPWLILEGHVDAIVCVNMFNPHIEPLRQLGIPVAAIAWDDRSVVVPKTREGMKLATNHLIDLGHRRIAYLGRGAEPMIETEVFHINERIGGYRDALAEAGLPDPPPQWIALADMPEAEVGEETFMRMLQACDYHGEGKLPFSALVCYNDAMAMGAVRGLSKLGLRVPEDLSIVACDDISASYLFEPVITSVDLQSYYMGQRTMQLLGEQIDLDPAQRVKDLPQEELMPKLAIHGSTLPYREKH